MIKEKGVFSMSHYLYIASQDVTGGILCCRLTADGRLEQLHRTSVDRPAFLCAGDGKLFALLREPFQMQSGIATYRIQPDGSLLPEGDIAPVHGTVSAHILHHRGRLYTANYLSGTTTRMPDKLLAHNGRSVDPDRQTCSHPHCVTPTPEGDYLCINDLGTDCIYVCTPDLEEVSRVSLPAGSGPRHLVFSPDGRFAYCSNEMGASVSVLSYQRGHLTLLHTVSALPEDYHGPSSGSAIRLSPDGKTLYVSLRQHDSVCVLSADGPELHPLRWIPSGGESPREIWLEDDFLLCANENSHNIQVISLKDPNHPVLTSTFPVTRPWCILCVTC